MPYSVNTSVITLCPPSHVVVGVIWNGSEIKAVETYTGVCIYIYIYIFIMLSVNFRLPQYEMEKCHLRRKAVQFPEI